MKAIARQLLGQLACAAGPHRLRSGQPRLWILMYHRIISGQQAQDEGEEPGMFVTPATFARHLEWIAREFDVVRLHEWVAAVGAGVAVPARACAITFDDGWQDNFEHAFPALQEAGMPATLFATVDYIGTRRQFWPNRIGLLLRHHPHVIDGCKSLDWLREAAGSVPGGSAGAARDPESFARLIALCKRYRDGRIESSLDEAETVIAADMVQRPRPMLDWQELSAMVESGVFDVGSHTCNHTRLNAGVPHEVLDGEIRGSRLALEQRLGRRVELFCYPNGDVTSDAEKVVQGEYRAAVTTKRGINTVATPLGALMRVGLHEHVSRTRGAFFTRLSCWL